MTRGRIAGALMGAAALALAANLGHTAPAGAGTPAIFERKKVQASAPPTEAPTEAPTTLATGASVSTDTPAPIPTQTETPPPTPTPEPTATSTPSATSAPSPSPSASALPEIRPFVAGHRTIPESMSDQRVTNMASAPITELVLFDWLKGTWRSHTLAQLPAGGSRDLGRNTYVFAPVLKGRWLFGASGTSDDEFYISYDPFARRYVALRIQGDPSYGLWVSYDGWRGNKIVFISNDSTAFGRAYVRRMTIEHPSARAFDIIDEEQRPDGSWSTDDVLEMTKQAS